MPSKNHEKSGGWGENKLKTLITVLEAVLTGRQTRLEIKCLYGNPKSNTGKTPIISPGLEFVQKAFLLGVFSGEFLIGKNFVFQNGSRLTIKAAKNTQEQPKTAN